MATTFFIASWPNTRASTISFSEISWAPPSTMLIKSAVPAREILKSEFSKSENNGKALNLPPIRPILTAPIEL